MPLLPYLDLANIVMFFLLTVVLVATRLGRTREQSPLIAAATDALAVTTPVGPS